jgi:hypothetical protein
MQLALATSSQSADEKRIAAKLRAIDEKLYVDGRDSIVLALNATDFPVYALRSVTDTIRSQPVDAIRHAGYQQIWIVGPSVDLVTWLG